MTGPELIAIAVAMSVGMVACFYFGMSLAEAKAQRDARMWRERG